jgi:hypothetical protein
MVQNMKVCTKKEKNMVLVLILGVMAPNIQEIGLKIGIVLFFE